MDAVLRPLPICVAALSAALLPDHALSDAAETPLSFAADAADEPGLIADGDTAVAGQVYIYLDGCPLVSVTPPANGRGEPKVVVLQDRSACTPVSSAQQAAAGDNPPVPGLQVQLFGEAGAAPEPQGEDVTLASGGSSDLGTMVIELSNLYPPLLRSRPPAPPFWIPGVFGDPSGDLMIAARQDLDGAETGGILRAGSTARGSDDDGRAMPALSPFSNPAGLAGAPQLVPAPVAAIPLPAPLLMLGMALCLLHWLRRPRLRVRDR